jgi:hypothetical protein
MSTKRCRPLGMNCCLRLRFLAPFAACLSLILPPVQAQERSKSAVGVEFQSVKSVFEAEVNDLNTRVRGGKKGYNPSDVNTILQRTKDATVARIPNDDKPLRGYIDRTFPSPVDYSTAVVPREDVERRFSLVQMLLTKLSRLDSFHLDLTVNTRPPDARFELIPEIGNPSSTATDGQLTNIYRGEYTYRVIKHGFKRIEEHINFIDLSGSTLECKLQPDPGPENAIPCKLK